MSADTDGVVFGQRDGPGVILRHSEAVLVAADGSTVNVPVGAHQPMAIWPFVNFGMRPTPMKVADAATWLLPTFIDLSTVPGPFLRVQWRSFDEHTGRFTWPWWDTVEPPRDLGVIPGDLPPRWWVHAFRGLQDGLCARGRLELLLEQPSLVLEALETCETTPTFPADRAGWSLAKKLTQQG